MDVSIIIPNYNGAGILSKNLPKVLEAVSLYKGGRIEIIIPDDASGDNSKEVIQKFISSIKSKNIVGKTISNTDRKKGGFSSNVNRGVKIATGEVIVLLNSDVFPHAGFLDPLLSHFADLSVFAVGCMDESLENGKTVLRGRGVGKWSKGFLIHGAGSLDKTNTLWVSCGSGAFRKSIWDTMGGLNNLYNPFYWEDIDLSYRAQKMGYKTIFEKKSVVVHEHSIGSIASNYNSYKIKKIAYRNQFFFVWGNITDINLFISHIFWLPYHIGTAIKGGDRAFIVGLFEAVIKIPYILNFRNKMIKLFKKTDTEIILKFKD